MGALYLGALSLGALYGLCLLACSVGNVLTMGTALLLYIRSLLFSMVAVISMGMYLSLSMCIGARFFCKGL